MKNFKRDKPLELQLKTQNFVLNTLTDAVKIIINVNSSVFIVL